MEQESNKLVPFAIVIAGALIAFAIYMTSSSNPKSQKIVEDDTPVEIPAVTDRDHLRGNPDAEIVIVEYSDTECPFCKVFHNTMLEVMGAYEDSEVAWVYRHFPIPQLHAKATKEAEATECATELGGQQIFWRYLDQIFERTESNDSLDPAELPKIAGDLGLDTASFNTCLSSGRYTDFIKKSIEEAVKIGARGTPYSVIVGKDGKQMVINGAEPYASVKAKIDSLLR